MNPLPPARVAPVRSVLRVVCALGFLLGGVLGVVGLFFVPGYAGSHTKPDLVWGRQGTQNGDLERPCAVAGVTAGASYPRSNISYRPASGL